MKIVYYNYNKKNAVNKNVAKSVRKISEKVQNWIKLRLNFYNILYVVFDFKGQRESLEIDYISFNTYI